MVTCRVIKYGCWKKVERLATKLGLNMEHEPGAHPGKLWIAMHGKDGRTIGGEEAGVIFMAWRAICAEVVRARKQDTKLRLQVAYAVLIRTILSRTMAHGAKWKKWYNGQRRWLGAKCVPHRHRNYKLISMEADSSFEVNKELVQAFEDNRGDLRG